MPRVLGCSLPPAPRLVLPAEQTQLDGSRTLRVASCRSLTAMCLGSSHLGSLDGVVQELHPAYLQSQVRQSK